MLMTVPGVQVAHGAQHHVGSLVWGSEKQLPELAWPSLGVSGSRAMVRAGMGKLSQRV